MSGQRTAWVHRIPVNVLSASFTNVARMPRGSRLIHCREQGGSIALWFEVPDPDAEKQERKFQIFGTGTGPIREGLDYAGTCIFADGELVLHVYEVAA